MYTPNKIKTRKKHNLKVNEERKKCDKNLKLTLLVVSGVSC